MSYSPYKIQIPESFNHLKTVSSEFIPTEEQLEASKLIRRFLNSTEKIFVLKGYAGTGKTTLVNFILKDYYMKGKLIAVSAFTNKATNVISRKTPFATGITLYKLLGLTADESSDVLKFRRPKEDSKKRSLVSDFDIVVLDEVSMVLDEDLNLLIKEINKMYSTTKLLIMGDPAQLEAVGQETESIAFSFENSFQLKNIVRQAEDSNIIKYSFCVREILKQLENNEKVPIRTKLNAVLNPNLDDLIIMKDARKFTEMMLEEFSSDNYKNNGDYVRAISYRNVSIDAINGVIRKNLFKEAEDTITVGENIILNYPVQDTDTGFALYDSSDELEIVEIQSVNMYDNSSDHCGLKIQFPYYNCLVSRRFDGLNGQMNIVNPAFKGKFNDLVSEWGKEIRKQKEAKSIYANEFYPFKKRFHTVSYNYAITAHKSQGSSISKIFFVEDDLEKINQASITSLWKAKYVAYTRASQQLIILNRYK